MTENCQSLGAGGLAGHRCDDDDDGDGIPNWADCGLSCTNFLDEMGWPPEGGFRSNDVDRQRRFEIAMRTSSGNNQVPYSMAQAYRRLRNILNNKIGD